MAAAGVSEIRWGSADYGWQWTLSLPAIKLEVKQSLYTRWGFQEVEAPRFQDIRHMKVVRLSAVRTGRVYPPGNIPCTHFC